MLGIIIAFMLMASPAAAREFGQWENQSPQNERPDGPLGRPHRELGEKIVVPNHKIKWDDGNPTGHGIIFIGTAGQVFCYVPPGGA